VSGKPGEAQTASVGLIFRAMGNGDVLVESDYDDPDSQENGQEFRAFFGMTSFRSREEAFGKREPKRIDTRRVAQGANYLRVITAGTCDGNVGAGVYLEEPNGTIVRGTSFVWLGEEARSYPSMRCEGEEQAGYESPTIVLAPSIMAELKDGTLLVGERELGLVLRVRVRPNGSLCSESSLVDNQLFLVDAAWLWAELRRFVKGRPTGAAGVDYWAHFRETLRKALISRGHPVGGCSEGT
jgi:hypothetical protein